MLPWLEGPPEAPTAEERARAAKALAAIRATVGRLTAPAPRPYRRASGELTEADRILECRHVRESDPELGGARYGFAGYFRRCLDCGRLDPVLLTPAQAEELRRDAARPVPGLELAAGAEPEPGASG